MAKKFTMEEHIRKHTMRENTYNPNCQFCNPSLRTDEIIKKMKKRNLLRSAID